MIHPFLQTRDETFWPFDIFFKNLKKYKDKFFVYMRMNLKSFEE